MNRPSPHLQPAALLDGRIVCPGPVCAGRFAYPPYYFGSHGWCVECEAAARRKGSTAEAEDAGVGAVLELGDYLARLSLAGLTWGDVHTLAEFYINQSTAAEIAAATGLTVCAVEKRVQRAREKLEGAGLPLPARPTAPATEAWAPETLSLLEQSTAGRWRLRRRARVARRDPANEE